MDHSHTYSFTHWLWLLLSSKVELSNCDKGSMVTNPKVYNYLALDRNLPNFSLIQNNMCSKKRNGKGRKGRGEDGGWRRGRGEGRAEQGRAGKGREGNYYIQTHMWINRYRNRYVDILEFFSKNITNESI